MLNMNFLYVISARVILLQLGFALHITLLGAFSFFARTYACNKSQYCLQVKHEYDINIDHQATEI